MSWILDLIVIAIAAVTIFFAVKNGFVRTLISTASFAVCIIVTVIFVSPLSDALEHTGIAENVKQTTVTHIADYIDDDKLSGIGDLLSGKSENFNTLARVAGFDVSELKSWYETNVSDGDEQASLKLAEKISAPIISLLASVVAVVILFLGTKLALWLVSLLLGQVMKLPVLHSFDKGLGVLLGVLLSVVRICLFCFLVKIVTENSLFINVDFISKLDPESTLLFRIFYHFDLFEFLRSLF